MTERWRCFVAVPLDGGLRAALTDAMASWRADPRTDGLRWVPPGALHITLAFLGPVEADQVAQVRARIAGLAAKHALMTRATGRLGAFARPGSARVLWYGVADPDGGLSTLAEDLAEALQLETEPYRPHVTLARARRRSVDLRGWIEAASESAPDGTIAVDELHVMRSHLRAGPARYETLASFSLGDVS
jgi:2'-5' RNA ligase